MIDGVLPTEEDAGFQSRSLFLMATSDESFHRALPKSLVELAVMEPSNMDASLVDDSQAGRVINSVLQNIAQLTNKGQERLLKAVYGDFCNKNSSDFDWPIISEGIGTGMVKNKNISELNEAEKGKWDTYLSTATLLRDEEIKIVMRSFFHLLPQISSKYSSMNESQEHVLNVYNRSRYEIALNIFPDITDEESKVLFSDQSMSVDKIRELAAN